MWTICLPSRWFTWNLKPYFLWKKKQKKHTHKKIKLSSTAVSCLADDLQEMLSLIFSEKKKKIELTSAALVISTFVSLCWGFKAQLIHLGHVEHGQFTSPLFFLGRL